METISQIKKYYTDRSPISAGDLVFQKEALKRFEDLSVWVFQSLPVGADRTTALTKLREAKDAAITGFLIRSPSP